MAANDVAKGGMGTEDNEIYLLEKEKAKPICIKGSKRKIAAGILEAVNSILKEKSS